MAATKSSSNRSRKSRNSKRARRPADGLQGLTEQLVNRIIKPLGLVVLTRERIQATLDEAAEHGRLTRSDANELVVELVRRGRQQTDELLSDLARTRARLSEPLDRLVRGSSRSLPLADYDELLARQVQERLDGLSPGELRQLREYERRHANRKSVLASIEKQLG